MDSCGVDLRRVELCRVSAPPGGISGGISEGAKIEGLTRSWVAPRLAPTQGRNGEYFSVSPVERHKAMAAPPDNSPGNDDAPAEHAAAASAGQAESRAPDAGAAPSAHGEARSDAALVTAVLAGERSAFEPLIRRHQQRVFGYLYRLLLSNPDPAQEVAQATFLKAYEHLAAYDPARPLGPWLMRIAHNEAANYLRTNARRPAEPLDEVHERTLSSSEPDPEAALNDTQEENARRSAVRKALARLPAPQREAVVLYFFEERSYREIAKTMGVPTGTVGTLINRAKRALRGLLGDGEGDGEGRHDGRNDGG